MAAERTEPALWLATPGAGAALDPATLAPEERASWLACRSERRRADWLASRALRLHAAPAAGAPASLSHSHGRAALLVGAAGTRVGVDLERVTARRVLELGGFAYDPHEARALAALPEPARTERFHVLWTLKEAFAKALAVGVLDTLRSCRFHRDPDGWRGEVPVAGPWYAAVHRLDDGFLLAAVVLGRAAPLPAPRPWPGEWCALPVAELAA